MDKETDFSMTDEDRFSMTDEDIFSMTDEEIAASRVVIVDDDPLITMSLRSFLELELEIEPVVFNVSTEASVFVKSESFDVIMSDFLMPDMDGIQLLTEAHHARPIAPRILLTGYADKENAIKAINEARLFQYIEKPWDNEHVKNVLINALERHHLIATIQKYVAELGETRRNLAGLKRGILRAFS
ncbi:MAG: response regulator [Deltaproteobacteria bacterium]|nr:response regulator [Deltaproteobacteria bacterium]